MGPPLMAELTAMARFSALLHRSYRRLRNWNLIALENGALAPDDEGNEDLQQLSKTDTL